MKRTSHFNSILNALLSSDDNILTLPKAQYLNLALEGGGIKGIAYAGGLAALSDTYYPDGVSYIDRIENVAGTSAGAISAMLIALGYSAKEISFILTPEKLASLKDPVNISRLLFASCDYSSSAIWKNIGLNKGQVLQKFIEDRIAQKFGDKQITFRQLHNMKTKFDHRLKDLFITGTNLSTQTPEIYSYESTPDMPIALAVRISASLPIFYKSVEMNGQLKTDGGIYNNYPINIFNLQQIKNNPEIYSYDQHLPSSYENEQSIGFVFDSSSTKKMHSPNCKLAINQIDHLLQTVIDSTGQIMMNNIYRKNSVAISTKAKNKQISTTNFNIKESSLNALKHNGYIQTKRFLTNIKDTKITYTSVEEKYFDLLVAPLLGQKTNHNMVISLQDIPHVIKFLLFHYQQSPTNGKARLLNEIRGLRGALNKCALTKHLSSYPINLNQENHFDSITLDIHKDNLHSWLKIPQTSPKTTSIPELKSKILNENLQLYKGILERIQTSSQATNDHALNLASTIAELEQLKNQSDFENQYAIFRTNVRNCMDELQSIFNHANNIEINCSNKLYQKLMKDLYPCQIAQKNGKIAGTLLILLLSPYYLTVHSIWLTLKILEKTLNTVTSLMKRLLVLLNKSCGLPLPERLKTTVVLNKSIKEMNFMIEKFDIISSQSHAEQIASDMKVLENIYDKLIKTQSLNPFEMKIDLTKEEHEALFRSNININERTFFRINHLKRMISTTLRKYEQIITTHNNKTLLDQQYKQEVKKCKKLLKKSYRKARKYKNSQSLNTQKSLRLSEQAFRCPQQSAPTLNTESIQENLQRRLVGLKKRIYSEPNDSKSLSSSPLQNILNRNPVIFNGLNTNGISSQMLKDHMLERVSTLETVSTPIPSHRPTPH